MLTEQPLTPSRHAKTTAGWGIQLLRTCFGARELERGKAKMAEEAEFTGCK